MTEDIVSINSPKWNYICGTKSQPWSQIETGGNKQRLTIHFSEKAPGNQRAATDSLSPPIHRTSQSPFPRKHYTSSPREEGGCQAVFLTTKSGGSKKGKLGSPKARYCGAAAAAARSLQSCPTLCDPIDGSPPGSPVRGILQARTLEWVAISFSNAWKWNVKVKSLSPVRLLATPWTAAHQAPPSMGFSRQEDWGGSPLPLRCGAVVKNSLQGLPQRSSG